jgi:hypothetical protein
MHAERCWRGTDFLPARSVGRRGAAACSFLAAAKMPTFPRRQYSQKSSWAGPNVEQRENVQATRELVRASTEGVANPKISGFSCTSLTLGVILDVGANCRVKTGTTYHDDVLARRKVGSLARTCSACHTNYRY